MILVINKHNQIYVMTYTHEANEKNWYTENNTQKHTHTKPTPININGNVEYFYDKQ